MARPRKTPPVAKKLAALPPPAPPPEPIPEPEPDPDDEEEEQEENDDDDDADGSDANQPGLAASAHGNGQFITSAEDALRLGGFDENSRQKNMAMEASLNMKANGGRKIPFNGRGMLKYDAAAQFFGNTQGDKCRVQIERVDSKGVIKGILPIAVVPNYASLYDYIKDNYWKGDEAAFEWTMFIRGHMQQAQDVIAFEEDPVQRAKFARNAEMRANLPDDQPSQAAQQPQQQAPAPQPQQQQQPMNTTYPGYPQAQMQQQAPQQQYAAPPAQQQYPQQAPYVQAPQQQAPQQYPPQQQQYPQQAPPQQYTAPAQQQYAPNPQYPQQAPPQQFAPNSQFGGPPLEPWNQPPAQPGQFGGAPQMPISYSPPAPPPRSRPAMFDEQNFEPPDGQGDEREEEEEEQMEARLAGRLGELETQLEEMKEMLAEQGQPAPAPPPAAPPMQPFDFQPETVQIHRPRPMDPRGPRMAAPAPSTAPAPAPNPAPPPMQTPMPDWSHLAPPPAPPPPRSSADSEALYLVNRQLEGMRGMIEGLRANVVEDRKMSEQQSKVMQTMRDMAARVDSMNQYVQQMHQAMYDQGQQLVQAQAAAHAAAQAAAQAQAQAAAAAAAAPPPPPPLQAQPVQHPQAQQQAPGPVGTPGYAPQQYAPQQQTAPQYPQQPAPAAPQYPQAPMQQMPQMQDPSLGFFSGQQYIPNPAMHAQAPQPPAKPAEPPPPQKTAMEIMKEQVEQTLQTVKLMKEMSMGFGMVPAAEVAAAQAAAAQAAAQVQAQVAAVQAQAAAAAAAQHSAPEPEPQSALASAAQMAAVVASGEEDPFKIKDLGGYRVVYGKDGKLADWITQGFMNADNIGKIIQSAQTAIAEARKQGEKETRLAQMEQELNNMRKREQEMQSRMTIMAQQAQQAQFMPPMDIDSYVNEPPPPPPMAPPPPPMPGPEDIPAVVVQPDPTPASDVPAGKGILESMRDADDLLED